MKIIARIKTDFGSKFGVPRQSGMVPDLRGRVVFEKEYRVAEAVRGLEDFSHLWLIWGFSANRHEADGLTVRPPRLGGNERVGVFASRSPFRPNRLGLSSVYIKDVEMTAHRGPVIHVLGADLMDLTPIYDIKPYVAYTDSHPKARSGFVDTHVWCPLQVEIPDGISSHFSPAQLEALRQVLAQDPRPRYHDDDTRIYGMPFAGRDIRFRVCGNTLTVIGLQ